MQIPQRAYYSVIQFCPDRSRFEAVNAGVVLCTTEPQRLMVKISTHARRAKRLFGDTINPETMKFQLLSMERRLKAEAGSLRTLDSLRRFAELQANSVMLTAPRSISVIDPEHDLKALFSELIPDAAAKRVTTGSRIKRRVDRMFADVRFKDRIIVKPEIEVPVLGRPFPVPYAYRNGSLNLVRPEMFRADDSKSLGRAEKLTLEASMIQRHSGQQQKVIVIPDIIESTSGEHPCEMASKISALFQDYDIRVVLPESLAAFADEVDQEAHAVV